MLDVSNVSRIGVFFVAFFICAAFIIPKVRYLRAPSTVLILFLYGWFLLIAPLSESPIKSYIVIICVLSTILISALHLQLFGYQKFVRDIVDIEVSFLFLSIIAYFVVPSLSRFLLWDGTISNRLVGLGSHPNSVAVAAAMTGVLLVSCRHFLGLSRLRFSYYIAVVIVVLLFTQSRTSLIAFMFGSAIYALLKSRHRGLLFSSGLLTFSSGLLFIALFPDTLVVFTRSGDLGELVTGTGRTYVWQEALKLIAESPIYGYGYNSTWFLFEKLADVLEQYTGDYVFPHSHNMFLQILLSGGYVALGIFIASIVFLLYTSIRLRAYEVTSITSCYLAYSMTESNGFFQYPESDNLLLAVCFALGNHCFSSYRRRLRYGTSLVANSQRASVSLPETKMRIQAEFR